MRPFEKQAYLIKNRGQMYSNTFNENFGMGKGNGICRDERCAKNGLLHQSHTAAGTVILNSWGHQHQKRQHSRSTTIPWTWVQDAHSSLTYFPTALQQNPSLLETPEQPDLVSDNVKSKHFRKRRFLRLSAAFKDSFFPATSSPRLFQSPQLFTSPQLWGTKQDLKRQNCFPVSSFRI